MYHKLVFVVSMCIWINHSLAQTAPNESTHVRTWTTWYDTDTPSSGTGDDETVATIRQRGYEICDGNSPIDAICRWSANPMSVFNMKTFRYSPDILFMPCTTEGIQCRNVDQITERCKNYQIRFECLSPTKETPENLGIIAAAAGLSVIVPISCVAIMQVVRCIRTRGRPASASLVENTEQSVQTDTSDLPPSYSFLFGVPSDTSAPTSPTGPQNNVTRLSHTDSSGDLRLPSSRISSSDLLSIGEQNSEGSQNMNHSSTSEHTTNETQHSNSNWRSRFPNMHLSIFDLFSSLGQRSPTATSPSLQTPPIQSPDLSYVQTPPPTYKDAILIINEIQMMDTNEESQKPEP